MPSMEELIRPFIAVTSDELVRDVSVPALVHPISYIRWGAQSQFRSGDFRQLATEFPGFSTEPDEVPDLHGNYIEEGRTWSDVKITNPEDESQFVIVRRINEVAFKALPDDVFSSDPRGEQVTFSFQNNYTEQVPLPDYLKNSDGNSFEPYVIDPFHEIVEVGWGGDFILVTLVWSGYSNIALQAILSGAPDGPVSENASTDGIGAGNVFGAVEDSFPPEGTQLDTDKQGLAGTYISMIANGRTVEDTNGGQGPATHKVHIPDVPLGIDPQKYPKLVYTAVWPTTENPGGVNPRIEAKILNAQVTGDVLDWAYTVENPKAGWDKYGLQPYAVSGKVFNPGQFPPVYYKLDEGPLQRSGKPVSPEDLEDSPFTTTGVQVEHFHSFTFDRWYFYREFVKEHDLYYQTPFTYACFFINVAKIMSDFREFYSTSILTRSPPPLLVKLKAGFAAEVAKFLDVSDIEKKAINSAALKVAKRRWSWYTASAMKKLENDLIPKFSDQIDYDSSMTADSILDMFSIGEGLIDEKTEDALFGPLIEQNGMFVTATFSFDFMNRNVFGVGPKFIT